VSAAPGAGKTVFAGLVFEALREADVVDRMVALVPRRPLVDQWVEALNRDRQIELKPHTAIERLGQLGVVATYQSLGTQDVLTTHQLQAKNGRTLLVLDEVHHLGDRQDGMLPAWARNVSVLAGDIESGKLGVSGVLNLSGTLWRSASSERISTVRYRRLDDNRLESLVDFDVSVGELVSRGELRPIDLYRLNAQVRIADYQNLEHVEGGLSDLDEKPARAAMASLAGIDQWRSAFVAAVLDRLEVAYRALEGHHVKAMIVSARQDIARAFCEEVNRQMRERGLRPFAEVAVSEDSEAQATLQRFRAQPRVGVLCTVDMAGEGYDCSDIAVIGYASNKLTSLYVRQVTARAMRVTQRERELGQVIPAGVVVPDAQRLVEQLVAYLAPFAHEVLIPNAEQIARRGELVEPGDGAILRLPLQRYVLEEARPNSDELVTVPYHDGSREDVEGVLARELAVELERANVPAIYAPRVIAASRRTVGDLLAANPFDRPSADTAVLERLARGIDAVRHAETTRHREGRAPTKRSATIEEQATMLRQRMNRWAGWWQVNGDSQASHFNRLVNDAGGMGDGDRDSASVEQLQRAHDFARRYIAEYCGRKKVKPPSGW